MSINCFKLALYLTSPSSVSLVEHEVENHLSRSFRVFSSQGGDLSWRFLVMIRFCKEEKRKDYD